VLQALDGFMPRMMLLARLLSKAIQKQGFGVCFYWAKFCFSGDSMERVCEW
jgi:hypothetical protein